MKVASLILSLLVAPLLCSLLFIGCVGGSSGGGGGGVAVVDTNDAPAPVSTEVLTGLTAVPVPASSALHPVPLSNSQYDQLREGWPYLDGNSCVVREDNGIQLAVVAFNANGNLAPAIAYLAELELTGYTAQGASPFHVYEDFRKKQPGDKLAGAWFVNTQQKWFDHQQSTGSEGNFGYLTNSRGIRYWAVHSTFGVPMYIGDPVDPQRRDQVAHLFLSTSPLKTIPLGVVELHIRVRFSLGGGAMLHFLVDRYPTKNPAPNQTQTQLQSKVEQIVTSHTYHATGSGKTYNITIVVPVQVLPQTDPNPVKKNPVPLITPAMSKTFLR